MWRTHASLRWAELKSRALLQLLEFRIVGNAGGEGEERGREEREREKRERGGGGELPAALRMADLRYALSPKQRICLLHGNLLQLVCAYSGPTRRGLTPEPEAESPPSRWTPIKASGIVCV
jgi:hypothetical protein